MSLGTLAIGWAVYQLLSGDDVGYLDLEHPTSENVLCLTKWPLRDEARNAMNFFDREQWDEWVSYRFNEDMYIDAHRCVVPQLSGAKCYGVDIPMTSIGRKLGRPLGIGDTLSYDVLDTYSWVFLLLAGWLWVQVVVHDLSLLATANKDFVLDLSGITEEFKCVAFVFNLIGCSSLGACCTGCKSRAGKLVGYFCILLWAPVALVWSVVIFLGVAVPVVSVVFLCYPARMSRFGVFLAALACAIYGLILAIHNLVYLCAPDTRAEFAVTWEAGAGTPPCVCGCVYPLTAKIVWQFALIGGVTVAKSIFLAMRCLKGLRRRNWANMLSVTFPVPVNAYAVEWKAPYGQPIKFRTEEGPLQPVQGELAFDPFAMMDEQPDSKQTLVHLRPVKASRLRGGGGRGPKRKLEGPKAVTEQVSPQEYIGCCGFPCLTGGKTGHLDIEESDGENSRMELGVSAGTSATYARGMSGASSAHPAEHLRSLTALSLESDADTPSQGVLPAAQKLAEALQVMADDALGPLAARALQDLNRVIAAAQARPMSPSSTLPPTPTPGSCGGLGEPAGRPGPELARVLSGTSSLGRITEERSSLIDPAQAEDHAAGVEHFFDESVGPLGLEVSWHDGEDRLPSVSLVKPGGEAERRGIRAGDALAELNGQGTLGRRRPELLPILGRRPLRVRVLRGPPAGLLEGGGGDAAASAAPARGGRHFAVRSGPREQADDTCFAGCGRGLSPCKGSLRATSIGRPLEQRPLERATSIAPTDAG